MSRLTEYYSTLCERYGYDRTGFAVGGMSASEVRRRFAFADGLGEIGPDGDVLVSTGISVTGPPHVGTLSQLLTTLALREADFDVRVTVADLVVYHAHGVSIERVRALAERYREFALALGFDAEELHIQSSAHDVLYTGQLLARYHDFADESDGGSGEHDTESPAFETELADAYERAGESPVGSATAEPTAFAHQHASHLLVADQLHPLVAEDYGTVLVVLGADNHRLAAGVREVLDRSPYAGTVAGLYTRLIRGYNGYPKLSKSIPDSRFTLDAPPARIRERVLSPAEGYDRPEQSLVFQMLRLASPYSVDRIESLRTACAARSSGWERAKREYVAWLVEMADTWKTTE